MFPLHFAIVPSARLCRPSRYSGNTLNEDPPNTHQTQSNRSRNTITKTPPKNNPANNQVNKNNQASQQASKPANQPASQQASQQARKPWLAGGVSRCEGNMKTFLFFTTCAKHLHSIAERCVEFGKNIVEWMFLSRFRFRWMSCLCFCFVFLLNTKHA